MFSYELCGCGFESHCSHLCLLFFMFPPKKSISKIMKNAFNFIKKALFALEVFKFSKNFPFLSTFPDSKSKDETGILMMPWTGLHKLANVTFVIIQKPLCIKLWKLPRSYITKKGIFLNVLQPKKILVPDSFCFSWSYP